MAQVYMSTIRRKEPESIHGWYLDAELALLVGEERAALALYEKVFAACPDYLSDLAFRIGALHAGQGRRAEAQRYWASPNAGAEALRWLRRFALEDSLRAHPVPFNPEPIEGLATSADEFLAVRSPDGSKWYFTLRRKEGAGLGLVLSHQLVQLMGGQLDYRTEAGVGSSFFFTLPMHSPAEQTA